MIEESANRTTGLGSSSGAELLRHRLAVGAAAEYRFEPSILQRHWRWDPQII